MFEVVVLALCALLLFLDLVVIAALHSVPKPPDEISDEEIY